MLPLLLTVIAVYGALYVTNEHKTFARVVRKWWHRLPTYRVRVIVGPKADANPTARRNAKLLTGRFGG